jgi:hypothetical protein
MRSLDSLITLARQRTNNTDYGLRNGISQNLCVQFANDAQDHLQSVIVSAHPQEFTTDTEISVLTGVETYSISDNVFAGGKLINVWYSPTGEQRDYYRLKPRTMLERQQQEGNDPLFYIRASGLIYLNPIPRNSSGKIKVAYYRELDDLDIARGTVNGTPSGATITVANTLTTSPNDLTTATEYVCISDKYGNVMLRNGVVSTVAGATLTLAANVSTYLVGSYSLANLADGKITIGKYTTTHSKMPSFCERYLLTYLQKRLLNKQSSNNALVEDDEMKVIENDILVSFGQPTEDVYEIPVLDSDVMS